MLVGLLREEHAALAQQRDDIGIGIEDIFTDKVRQTGFFRVAAVIIDRRKNRQTILGA